MKPVLGNAATELQLHREIERLAPEHLEFLKRLVEVPSVTGQEGPCQALVKERMSDIGVFENAVVAGTTAPFRPTGRAYEDRPSIVGRVGRSRGPCLVLSAHVDTAPVDDPSAWRFPPYAARVEDGRLYGRGVLDDKAGVAMLLLLADCFKRLGVMLPGSIVFQSVIEDEDSGNGTLACTVEKYHCEAAIIVDGTWPFRILDGHLGMVSYQLEVVGPHGLLSKTVLALRNALEQANRAEPEWEGVAFPFRVSVGPTSTEAPAGSHVEASRVELQVSFPPSWTAEQAIRLIEETARQTVDGAAGASWTGRPGILCCPPFANRGNRMVRTLARTIRRLRGTQEPVRTVAIAGHSDLRHLRRADGGPADACLYGPGGGENPHRANEYYRLGDFVPVAQNIASAVLAWFQDA